MDSLCHDIRNGIWCIKGLLAKYKVPNSIRDEFEIQLNRMGKALDVYVAKMIKQEATQKCKNCQSYH